MEEIKITSKDFLKKVTGKNFKASSIVDRIGRCIECGANREVTYWYEEGELKKFIIVSCPH